MKRLFKNSREICGSKKNLVQNERNNVNIIVAGCLKLKITSSTCFPKKNLNLTHGKVYNFSKDVLSNNVYDSIIAQFEI